MGPPLWVAAHEMLLAAWQVAGCRLAPGVDPGSPLSPPVAVPPLSAPMAAVPTIAARIRLVGTSPQRMPAIDR